MDREVANRYVTALAEVVTEPDSNLAPGAALEQIREFGRLLEESADLASVLASPAIQPPAKRGLVREIGVRCGLDRIVVNFVCVVVDHRRTADFGLLVEIFEQWLDGHLGRVALKVRSASPLAAGQRADLERRFRALTGNQVRAAYREEPSLLGGAAVQVGSVLYDGSLRTALGSLAGRLASGSH